MDLPVNLTVGPPLRASGNGQVSESRTGQGPVNPQTLGGERGIEWIVAMLGIAALLVIILFRLAGFQAAIAVRLGG